MTDSRDLGDRISALSDDSALEAINLLAGDLLGAATDAELAMTVASAGSIDSDELADAIGELSPAEGANLARLALLAAVESGRSAEVALAIDSTGEKAVLLEISIAVLLALAALHEVITKGEKSHVTEKTVTTTPEGVVTVHTVERVEKFSVGAAIAPLISKFVNSGE